MALQKLVADLVITLAGGATETVSHGLHSEQGEPLIPDFVIPNQNTALAVVTANDKTITFINPTDVPLSALFHIEHRSTLVEGDKPPLWWQGGAGGGQGGNADIYADPVNGNDANPGTQALPVLTFAQGLRLLLGLSTWTGKRTLHLAPGQYAPANTGSFGTAGIFAWGNAGPLGLEALPIYIEGSLRPFQVGFTGLTTVVVSNVATITSPAVLAADDLRGAFLVDANGNVFGIVHNTACGAGGTTDLTLNAVPGAIEPTILDPCSVLVPNAEVQLPVDGEWNFQQMPLALQDVQFTLQSSAPGSGSTLFFSDCRVWAKSVWFKCPGTSEVAIVGGSFEARPGPVDNVWALDPNSPFNNGISQVFLSAPDNAGGVSVSGGGRLSAPWTQSGGFFFVDGPASNSTLQPPFLGGAGGLTLASINPNDGATLNAVPFGAVRGELDAADFSGNANSTCNVSQCDLGTCGYSGSVNSKWTFKGVGNMGAVAMTATTYGLSAQLQTGGFIDAATSVIGTGGAGSAVAIGAANVAYAAIIAGPGFGEAVGATGPTLNRVDVVP